MPSSSDVAAQVASALKNAQDALRAATDVDALRRVANEHSGKGSVLVGLKSSLGSVTDIEARKSAGRAINEAMQAIEALVAQRLDALERDAARVAAAGEAMDLTEHVGRRTRGHPHIVTQAWQRLEDVFVGMGFKVAEGPEVETDFHNFTALNMPPNHPARSSFDTLFVRHGAPGSTLLRTHTSPVQIRVMQEWDLPIYAVMPGRVFRRDTPDATHMPVFHQIEGLVVDKGITFAHLAGTIEEFTKAFFGSDFTSRLRPSFFPFTEPSAEFDVRSANGKWVELGGCGMVHPNVLRAGGIDPEVYTGFAFGFGIDRMAKERHAVADLRDMYANDLRFVRQF
ncbi:MAG: phenylalanine--tRNA ligase subunit alpha [Actinomycetota bacterium]|jgi:phenylalanyl-tRNA synthetase alpha chain